MTHFSKPFLGIALVLALGAQPALAQKKDKNAPAPAAAAGTVASGIAVANLEAAIGNSDAYRLAATRRQTDYKAYYDQAEARAKQLEAQIKPMADKFNADRAANKPEATLVPQVQAIQQLQERGKQEIQQILMPVALSEAYVNEQISDKLDQAVQTAMTKKGVTLVLQPGAVVARANAHELTPAIIAELNTLIPAAQLTPPQGWLPREIREQQAAQQAAQQPRPAAAAPAAGQPAPRPATPAGPQPDGR
jgi:Skp family chaperone for outer membrane proteins